MHASADRALSVVSPLAIGACLHDSRDLLVRQHADLGDEHHPRPLRVPCGGAPRGQSRPLSGQLEDHLLCSCEGAARERQDPRRGREERRVRQVWFLVYVRVSSSYLFDLGFDLDCFFYYYRIIGANMVTDSSNALALGWTPKGPSILETMGDDVKRVLASM